MPLLVDEDIAYLKRAFRQLDANGDGYVTPAELQLALRDKMEPSVIQFIVENADRDHDGRLGFGEFMRAAQMDIPVKHSSPEGAESPFSSKSAAQKLKTLVSGLGFGKDGSSQPYIVQAGRTISFSKIMEKSVHTNNDIKTRCCYIFPLIHPDSPKLAAWQALMAFAIIYAAIMTPFLLAFQDIISEKSATQGNTLVIVDTVFNFIFMIDIIICFLTMYLNHDGQVVSDPKLIAKKYITTWFLPDLISCIPLDIITQEDFAPGLYAKLARMGKLARVFRLLKILKIMKLLRLIKYYREVDRIFQNIVTHNKYEGPPAKMYQFGKFVICALLAAHVAGCIWFALADFHETKEDTWLERFDILGEDVPLVDQYVASIYFVITTLTTVGYGDISARTTAEIVAAIFLMMCGVLGYSMAVGTVSSIMMQDDERQVILESKLTTLAHFAKTTNMDLAEYRKIRRHVIRKYSESLDWMQQLEGPARLASLLSEMPVVLRSKMLRHMHSGRHLDIEFFQRYPDDDFFIITVPVLSSEENDAGDMVYLRGDYAERVYFLTHGTISFLDLDTSALRGIEKGYQGSSRRIKIDAGVYEELEKKMAEISPFQVVIDGSTFGEFEVLLSLPRQLCVRCEVACDMLSLHKKDLLRILAEFPAISKQMMVDARTEYEATLQRRNQARADRGIKVSPAGGDGERRASALTFGQENDRLIPATSAPDLPSSGSNRGFANPGSDLPVASQIEDLSPANESPSSSAAQVEMLESKMNAMLTMEDDLTSRQEKLAGDLGSIQDVLHKIDLRIQAMVLG